MMVTTTTLLPSHAEGIKRILRRSILVYMSSFFHVLPLAVILTVVSFLPQILTLIIGVDVFAQLPPNSLHRLWIFLINLVSLTFFTAMLWHIRCIILQTHERISEDMNIAIRKLPLIFIAALILTLVLMAISISFSTVAAYFLVKESGQISFEISGLFVVLVSLILLLEISLAAYIYISYYFYLPIILMENQGVISALQRSAKLVKGNWWKVLIVQATPWLVYFLILIILKVFFGLNIHINLFIPGQPSVFGSLIHMLIFMIIIPWSASVLIVQLHNLELKKHSVIPK